MSLILVLRSNVKSVRSLKTLKTQRPFKKKRKTQVLAICWSQSSSLPPCTKLWARTSLISLILSILTKRNDQSSTKSGRWLCLKMFRNILMSHLKSSNYAASRSLHMKLLNRAHFSTFWELNTPCWVLSQCTTLWSHVGFDFKRSRYLLTCGFWSASHYTTPKLCLKQSQFTWLSMTYCSSTRYGSVAVFSYCRAYRT